MNIIKEIVSFITKKNNNEFISNKEYEKLVNDINGNINVNYICNKNDETISNDVQYSIGDLITDICHLMYSVDYNNQPHNYTNMNTYLIICIEFVEDIIQQISIFESSLNDRGNIIVAKKNLKIQCFIILGIYHEKFEEVNFNDSNIKYFNSILYKMIIKIFNYEYNVTDFDSIETTFTTYSNVRLTWEIIHKKLLILQTEKKGEYNKNNIKLMIENSNTIFGVIEDWFNPKNTNNLQLTNF